MLEVGGIPLLHKAIDALADAADVVVVGPQREGVDGVRWTREEPAGGGPVAALAAGLAVLPTGDVDVAVLAADLPGVQTSTCARLRAAIGGGDGAVLVDATGRRQWLTGVWRAEALRRALPAETAGASVHATLGALDVVEVPAERGEDLDVDTPEDLHRGYGKGPNHLHRGHTGEPAP